MAHLYQYRDAQHQRTRINHCCLVQHWPPQATLRQNTHTRLCSLPMGTGDPIGLVLEDSKQANRGRPLEAVAKMTDARTDTDRSGHQDGGAIRRCRDAVSPYDIRRYVTPVM